MILSSKPILILALLIAGTITASAQCIATPTDNCVSVHQSILDKASHAIDELTEARKVIAAFEKERGATDFERAAYKNALAIADNALEVFKKGVADRDTVITMQQKALELYSVLVEKLTAQINRPKSAWQKFIGVVEKIVVLAAGVTIGRGL
jgi:hypothetical protein